jgi:hypothetical protein
MKASRRGFVSVAALWPVSPILCLWLGAASAHLAPRHRLHSASSEATPVSGATRGIDGETIITGCFNFTKVAQAKTAGSRSIIRDQALVAQDTRNRDTCRQRREA